MKMLYVAPIASGRITENLYVLRTGTANFYIYTKNGDTVCFDTGFGKNRAVRELSRYGICPGSVSHLFLTHTDFDHTGGLDVFCSAQIYLSTGEEQMITRKKARALGFIYNRRINRPYHLLKDQDTVTAGSIHIRAIETPGHTPGSMSYVVDGSVLLTGDAFRLDGNRAVPLERFTMDTRRQKESIRKLARLEPVGLICTAHWGYANDFHAAFGPWME